MKIAAFCENCAVSSHWSKPTFQRYMLLPSSELITEAPLKCRSTSRRLHGCASQKALIVILGAIRACNLTRWRKKTKRQRKFPLVLYACFWNVGTTFWGKWSYLEEQRETQEDLGDSCRSHVEVQDARRTAQWEARHATESHSTSVDNRRFRGVQYSNKKMYVKVSQQLPFIMINKIINIVSTVSASLVIMWCQ
jgi:hypothetical protein